MKIKFGISIPKIMSTRLKSLNSSQLDNFISIRFCTWECSETSWGHELYDCYRCFYKCYRKTRLFNRNFYESISASSDQIKWITCSIVKQSFLFRNIHWKILLFTINRTVWKPVKQRWWGFIHQGWCKGVEKTQLANRCFRNEMLVRRS